MTETVDDYNKQQNAADTISGKRITIKDNPVYMRSRFGNETMRQVRKTLLELDAIKHSLEAASADGVLTTGGACSLHSNITCALNHLSTLYGELSLIQQGEPTTCARFCKPWVADHARQVAEAEEHYEHEEYRKDNEA